jgi:hypothetical protein
MSTLARLVFIPLLSLLLFSMPSAHALESRPAFSQAELDQMLAPIALYPDALLSQILMAATYPLEVVEAARWSRAHPHLKGEAAVEAVADKDWDPSVKALVAFPQILARMDEDLEWTKRLGDAFLLQEEQVMATIQALRERAYANGHLESLPYMRAYRQEDAIYIAPRYTRYVYVPYYHPLVVYGPWWWPAHPPVFWAPPPGFHAHAIFFWGSGILVTPGFFFSFCDWPRRQIVIAHLHEHLHKHHLHKHHFFAHDPHAHHLHHRVGHKWRHDSKHRRGVAYHDEKLQKEFGRSSASGVVETRIGEQQQWHRDAHEEHDKFSHDNAQTENTLADVKERQSAALERLRRFDRSETDRDDTGKRSLAIRNSDDPVVSEKRIRNAKPNVEPSGTRHERIQSDAESDKARDKGRERDIRSSESRFGNRVWTPDASHTAKHESGNRQRSARHADMHRALSEKQEALRGRSAQSFQSAGTESGRNARNSRIPSRGENFSRNADSDTAPAQGHRAGRSRDAVMSQNTDNSVDMSDYRPRARRSDNSRGQGLGLDGLSTRSSAWTGRSRAFSR